MADLKKPADPQQEIEMLVGELEERVDRLRAIYEQYFMGYEKLEPTIARKDVDRRFVVLRKANIRNTALRFRFNVVTQKFNTYAMYWTRICRQIEEGTFKRHVLKANRRFGNARRPEDLSIDVDLGDFEVEMDDFDADDAMADALADAEAAAAAQPTEPPARPQPRPSPRIAMPEPATPVDNARTERPPDFGAIEDDLGADTLPPPSTSPQRVARHAVLPVGVKQRVLVKKNPGGRDAAPNSSPTPTPQPAPVVRRPMPSAPDGELPPMRRPMPSAPDGELPPMRRPMPSAPDSTPDGPSPNHGHVHRSPPGLARPATSPSAISVHRVPVAKPIGESVGRLPTAAPNAPNPAPSIQRVPVAAPRGPNVAPSVRRIPTAAPNAPNAAPSVQRVPAAAEAPPSQRIPAATPNPALGRTPSTRPAGGPPSTPRVPTSGRVPIGLPSSVGRVPTVPATEPAPPSDRRIPAPPPSQRGARPGGPMPAAPAIRPPAPSVPDSEHASPPSRRPPPPLPSQLKK